ncbi:hypothetical protein DFQ28_000833 [Apophysomyces sp. BC1034]|nr:hypothetical protein DFQ28_000833 [Apophysomyces sp. BC1034]
MLMQYQQQQQQQQQPQQQTPPQVQPQPQPGALMGQPIWTGQIVWQIKTQEGSHQEFSFQCGAFAVTLRGNSVSAEEYRPEIWPKRLMIAGSAPFGKIHQQQALDNKLPFCHFRPLNTSSQQDQTNFGLLVRNLESKKYASLATSPLIATIIFNLQSPSDQQHGVMLTYTSGKLIGMVFTRTPLPEYSTIPTGLQQQQQQQPQQNGGGMNAIPGSVGGINGNMTPAQVMAGRPNANGGLNLLNASNVNIQQLLQTQLRQQQILNAASVGNPVTSTQGINNGVRPAGLNPQSLLLSNINLGNVGAANLNMGNANGMMGLNTAGMAGGNPAMMMTPTIRDLQQRILMNHRQQQQQHHQQQQ